MAQMQQRRADASSIHDLLLSPRERTSRASTAGGGRGEAYPARDAEPPLRCDDIEAPTYLPDPERVRSTRAVEMRARFSKLSGEAPDDETVTKTGEQGAVVDDTLFDQQWKAAQVKVAALQAGKEAERVTIAREGEMKRKAECEQRQAEVIEASVVRIEKRLKRFKLDAD